jgi:hypothetical protein
MEERRFSSSHYLHSSENVILLTRLPFPSLSLPFNRSFFTSASSTSRYGVLLEAQEILFLLLPRFAGAEI